MPLGLADVAAGYILAGVTAYALLGGADFGGGVWDLLARGPRGEAQRAAISDAMGPVWEANHVWLIFVIVLLFTAFPDAFALLSLALFVPWHLVLLGIILRGAAFVFRAYGPRAGAFPSRWGVVFGAASLVTPLVLGMSLGAVVSGELRLTGDPADVAASAAWLAPESWALGLLAVAVCAYLAAAYLTLETEGALREDFRRRALWAWAAVALTAAATLATMQAYVPGLAAGFLRPRALPVVLAGALAAAAALWGLIRRRYHVARAAAITEVVVLILGWALLMQYPYLIYPDLTLAQAAAPAGTLVFVAWAVPAGAVVLVPSLVFLFRVFKMEALRGGV